MSKPGLAWLWAFLGFLFLAFISQWREVPVFLAEKAPAGYAEGAPMFRESAAVLPFENLLLVSPYAVGDLTTKTERPAAVDRREDGSVVCALGAAVNHVGPLDGRLLAELLVRELAVANVFSSVRVVGGMDELKDGETVLIRGTVLDALQEIRPDGKRKYVIGVELIGERTYGSRMEPMPFMKMTFRQRLAGGVRPAVYEVGEVVREMYKEVPGALGEAMRRAP